MRLGNVPKRPEQPQPQRRRLIKVAYHVKDDGLLRLVGSGRNSAWELANIPTRIFEDFVIWKCQVCGKLLNSDVSLEHSYKLVEKATDDR